MSNVNLGYLTLDIGRNKAFSSVFDLGFALGCQDRIDGSLPTDETGLHIIKEQLEEMTLDSLHSLAGIGALVGAANLKDLMKEDLENVGIAINNLAKLGIEAQNHVESIEMDLNRRKPCTTDPEQTALFADLRKAAQACQAKNPDFSYLEALQLSVMRMVDKTRGAEAQNHVDCTIIDQCQRRQVDNADRLIATALADGRLLFSQKAWAEKLGKSDFSALVMFLENQQSGMGAK